MMCNAVVDIISCRTIITAYVWFYSHTQQKVIAVGSGANTSLHLIWRRVDLGHHQAHEVYSEWLSKCSLGTIVSSQYDYRLAIHHIKETIRS